MKKITNLKSKGFTLIELLVVVAMIGILATLVLANLNAARERGRDARRKSDVDNIQTALRIYYNDFGVFPTGSADYEIMGCGAQGDSTCAWGGTWTAASSTYMQTLPTDSISTQSYRYTRNNLDSYTFQVCLENASDESGEATSDTTWCPSGWMYEVVQ